MRQTQFSLAAERPNSEFLSWQAMKPFGRNALKLIGSVAVPEQLNDANQHICARRVAGELRPAVLRLMIISRQGVVAGVLSISRCRQPYSHQFEQIIANILLLQLLGQH